VPSLEDYLASKAIIATNLVLREHITIEYSSQPYIVASEADYAREMELETDDVKRRPEHGPAIGAQPAAKKLMTRAYKDCKHSVAIPDGFDETSRVPDPSLHGISDPLE